MEDAVTHAVAKHTGGGEREVFPFSNQVTQASSTEAEKNFIETSKWIGQVVQAIVSFVQTRSWENVNEQKLSFRLQQHCSLER